MTLERVQQAGYERRGLPQVPRDPVLLGESYLKAGDKTAAAASFRKALEANPDNPVAKQRLSELESTPPR